MEKVYIVIFDERNPVTVAVFSSKEKAEAYATRENNPLTSPNGDDRYFVREMTVDELLPPPNPKYYFLNWLAFDETQIREEDIVAMESNEEESWTYVTDNDQKYITEISGTIPAINGETREEFYARAKNIIEHKKAEMEKSLQ